MWLQLMQNFVKWLDPRLNKYRAHIAAPKPQLFTPKTEAEFIDVIRRTPRSVLSTTDRDRIAAVMSFDSRTVADLMVKRSAMVFVSSTDVLGPLVLDKLWKSGFTNFPVLNAKEKVIGILHTEALNALEIRNTDQAAKYIDKNVCYLHTTDSLDFVVKEIARTNSYYFLVLDEKEGLAGFFTTEMLLNYLLN